MVKVSICTIFIFLRIDALSFYLEVDLSVTFQLEDESVLSCVNTGGIIFIEILLRDSQACTGLLRVRV